MGAIANILFGREDDRSKGQPSTKFAVERSEQQIED
jgi:hypothetical protein